MSYLVGAHTPRRTPQSEPIPGSTQIPNAAGGHAYPVDDWVRLERFLILGTEKGTYHVGEEQLTAENAGALLRCLKADGVQTVDTIARISASGRAPKNDAAIFALALALQHGDAATKRAAVVDVRAICRTGTHILQLAATLDQFGWSSVKRRAVASWYLNQSPSGLAYQLLKYQSRTFGTTAAGKPNTWTHHDVMHLVHPRFASSPVKQILADWAKNGWPGVGETPHPADELRTIWAYERAKSIGAQPDDGFKIVGSGEPVPPALGKAAKSSAVRELVLRHRLTREMLPTEFLNDPLVWTALLGGMPITALVRNLGKMTAVGAFERGTGRQSWSELSIRAAEMLRDPARLRGGRVHPVALMAAAKVYSQGHGDKGKLAWAPNSQILDALHDAFHVSFGALSPTCKRRLIAVDLSGSMETTKAAGLSVLSCREAAAALVLTALAADPTTTDVVGFSCRNEQMIGGQQPPLPGTWMFTGAVQKGHRYAGALGIAPLPISTRQRLDDVLRVLGTAPAGGTDLALPVLYAGDTGRVYDSIEIVTDNETWAGLIHPMQALRAYRQKTGVATKLVVAAMSAAPYSVADPDDAGSLDVVGLDAAVPTVIADFVRGGPAVVAAIDDEQLDA
jgi:60 kDa SS-A/Ro ribonucleoprotein